MTQQKKTPPPRSAIVILGMHRSGTSALAGVLNMLGCDLPETLMPANAYNEKGYFESNAIRLLNDRVCSIDMHSCMSSRLNAHVSST